MNDFVIGAGRRIRIAVLLSCDTFEGFFTDQLGLTRRDYLDHYRNDWVWDYGAALRQDYIEVVVYIPTRRGAQVSRTKEGRLVRWLPIGSLTSLHERIPVLRRTPIGRWLYEALATFALLPSLRDAMSADKIDLLYVQEYWTGRFDVLATLPPGGRPIIGADHGGTAARQFNLFKRLVFPRVAALTCQSEPEARSVGAHGGRAQIVGNPIDTEFFTPPALDSARPSRILHVARLVESHKRTSVVINAMRGLPVEFHLDVVGSGPDERALRELTNDLNLQDRIRFHGFVSDKTILRNLYRSACAVVQPSLHEARLLVALEAMACGTPCVLTDIPVFREIVDDSVTGRIVAPDAASVVRGVLDVVAGGQECGRRRGTPSWQSTRGHAGDRSFDSCSRRRLSRTLGVPREKPQTC